MAIISHRVFPLMYVFCSALFMAGILTACSEKTVTNPSLSADSALDCPSSPNCVSSEAKNSQQRITPFQLKPDFSKNWDGLQQSIAAMPRTRIVAASEKYIHAECKSRIFRFTDDLELKLDPLTGIVDARSASRLGYSDLGVNKKRVERLRKDLKGKNIID